MKKVISFFILLTITTLAAKAQSDPLFGNFNETHAYYNPGYVGYNDYVNALFLNRTQWAGFNRNAESGTSGNPVSSLLTAETTINLFGLEHGVGVAVLSDEIGFQNDIEVKLAYSYKHQLEIGTLGIGISGSFIDHQISPSWSETEEGYWNKNDDLLPSGENTDMVFDLGFGAFLKNDKYEVGISMTHLREASPIYELNSDADSISYYYSRTLYLTGKYNIKLPDPLFELHPSFIYRTDFADIGALTLGASIIYNNKVWGGAFYSLGSGFAFNIGTELINELKVGYQLEIPTTEMFTRSYGSHEVYVTYSFDLGLKRDKKYKSVRFL